MSSHSDCPTFPTSYTFDGHVRRGNRIFGALNGDPNFLLHLPTPEEASSPAHDQWDLPYQRTTWISQSSPHFLFVPRDNPFHGPLFNRLRIPRGGYPCELDENNKARGWMLHFTLRHSWEQLENALLHTLHAMMSLHGFAFSLGQVPHPRPSQFGYNELHFRDRQAANALAIRARNAFLPLMGEITQYFIALDDLAPLAKESKPWRQRVLQEIEPKGVSAQWFADLEKSAVGNMKTPRVGGIFDFTHHRIHSFTQNHRLEWVLPLIIKKLPIPLYFHWGEITSIPKDYPIPPALQDNHFLPDPLEIQYLADLPGQVAFSPWDGTRAMRSLRTLRPFKAPTSPSPATRDSSPAIGAEIPAESPPAADFTPQLPQPEQNNGQHYGENMQAGAEIPAEIPPAADFTPQLPHPEKNSGQHYGENVQAFFARRRARNEEVASKETSTAQQKRLQREAAAAKQPRPGKKGPSVFVWDEEDGFFIRRSITRIEAREVWDAYTPAQRLYDGFRNEWDLCTALAPDEEPEDDDPEGDLVFPELPDIPDVLLPEEAPGAVQTEDDLMRAYDLEDMELDDDVWGWYEPYHNILEIPYARFGFTPPIAPATYKNPVSNEICLKAMGDSQWPGFKPEYCHLPSLLAYLLHDVKTLSDIPADLLDLRQEHADIASQSNWAISVHPEQLVSSADPEYPKGKVFYVLRPTGSGGDELYLVLSSAVTTLQVIRMGWGPDVRDIATCLREYGAEFRVCIRDRVYANPRPPNLSEYTGLGFRKENYTPTVVDYRVYVAQLTDFLRSERGVLALQAGGILGRLAKFAVNTNLMCLRPGPDVFRTGIRLWDGRSSTAYWDNCLTMDEINLICGVYEIGTGRVNKVTDVKQTTQISWWPKPAMFEKSGMNIGWWSADCERWFLAREALIKENRAKLYTSKEWKSGLRFFTQPHKIAVSNERICAEFLEKKLGGV